MALTRERINNLKPGDPIVIHTTFDHVDSDGDVRFLTPNSCGDDSHAYINLEYVYLPGEPVEQPKPKYDPTRLFKKGDKVRVVTWNGRDIARMGQIGRVVSDEYNSKVELAIDGWASCVYYPVCHLELVTPVEELEPYSVVRPENYQCVRIMKEKRIHSSIPFDEEECVYRTLEEAKAAAEAECDRLNEEWRKEQSNDLS